MSDSILKPYRNISHPVRAVQITPELFELAFSQRATELDGVSFHCEARCNQKDWYVRVHRKHPDEWHTGKMGDWIVRHENGWTQIRAEKLFPMEYEAMQIDPAVQRRELIDQVMQSLRQRDWDKACDPGGPECVANPFINSILLAYEAAENPEKYQVMEAQPLSWIEKPRDPLTREQAIELHP